MKADQNDLRLDKLFSSLKSSSSIEDASLFEIKIWNIWMEHTNPKVKDNLFLGLEAMKYQEFEDALVHFNKALEYDPESSAAMFRLGNIYFVYFSLMFVHYKGSVLPAKAMVLTMGGFSTLFVHLIC